MNSKIEALKTLIAESTEMMQNLESEIQEIENQNRNDRIKRYEHFIESLAPLSRMLTRNDGTINIDIPYKMCHWDFAVNNREIYQICISSWDINNDAYISLKVCKNKTWNKKSYMTFTNPNHWYMRKYFNENKFHEITTHPDYDLDSLISYITEDFTQQMINRINNKINGLNQRYEDAKAEEEAREI